MLYPKKNSMHQLNGKTGEVETTIKGGERIFSREDTKMIVSMVQNDTDSGQLGKFVCSAIKKQDSRKPEYTKD